MLARLSSALGRRPGWTIAVTGLLCACAYAASLLVASRPDKRVVVGDAVHYFVYLRSLVFDRDLRFQNEYLHLYGLSLTQPPPPDTEWIYTPLATGHTRNLMPIGTALVWAPLYLAAAALSWILHLAGVGPAPDGYSRALQATTAVSGIAAATLGAWLSFLVARDLYGPLVALWATLAVWLGSSAIYYSLVSPTYSHPVSMLATSLVVFLWWRTREDDSIRRFALVGAAVGAAALVRPQDVVFLAAPLLDALRLAGRSGLGWRAAALRACTAGAAAAVVFLPQMIAWTVIFGSPLLVPQGSGFLKWNAPQLLPVLFSTYRGLFTWTPVLLAATAGLFCLGPSRRPLAVACGVIFVLSCYVNASVADWWAGEAFGARRFVSCVPIFVIGAAALFARWRAQPGRLTLAVAMVVGLNLLLLLQYQLFLRGWRDIAPYPDTLHGLWLARFVVPLRLLARLAARG
jgi:hypothetical protein